MNADTNATQSETIDGLNHAEVERILDEADSQHSLDKRIEQVSARLLGRPYVECPLGGGPGLPEKLTASLEGFDCVTFMESVLALALSNRVSEFVATIRQLRYEDGQVDWHHRNHYMVDWVRRNEARGFVTNLTDGADTVEKTCELGLISGLPARRITFRFFRKERLPKVESIIESGDLILFVSIRDSLDVFHTGILVKTENAVLLRHATRTAGAVVEQPLREFVDSNELAGFILLRPLWRR